MKLLRTIGLAVICVGAGVLGALLYSGTTTVGNVEKCASQFPLTNQDLGCEEYAEAHDKMSKLNTEIEAIVSKYVAEKKVLRASVWVRDLTTRQWAAVNHFELYAPASLLKVPLMIAYYKLAELQPNVLTTSFEYVPPEDASSLLTATPPIHTLTPGKTYTTQELIDRMIVESDNGAALFLYSKIEPVVYERALLELGVRVPSGADQNMDIITTKHYANIFRVLFNASYLNREYSQKALELLHQAEFKGMSDLLPESTVVAHKYGERIMYGASGSIVKRELHDCGIVYKVGAHPFSLCIMTEGTKFDEMISVIQNITLLIHNEF